MNKKNILALTSIFFVFYYLNYFMPMIFGDDYVYAFIWQGKSMAVPLGENATRISSWRDLLMSQWIHYFTWNGRTVSHTLAQLFLWWGKDVFNIVNAVASTFLITEIYWCTHKGIITLNFDNGFLYNVFFCLWVFTPRFSPVFLWIMGACNYLWPSVLLLGFLLPYIRKYYNLNEISLENGWFSFILFLGGMLVGWTNENSICWIILMLTLFLYKCKNNKCEIETWMILGLVGLIVGYALLILSPGNIVRLHSASNRMFFSTNVFLHHIQGFTEVFLWQLFLWHYCIRSLYALETNCAEVLKDKKIKNLKKEITLVKMFCILAFCMSAIMLFSPEFPLRSAYPGTVQLIIATGILMRIQKEYGVDLLAIHVKKFLTCVGVVYFILSAGIMAHHLYEHHSATNHLLTSVQQWKQERISENSILTYRYSLRKRTRLEDLLSGCNTFDNILSKDPNFWENVAFARYYGIKGIRMIKENSNNNLE